MFRFHLHALTRSARRTFSTTTPYRAQNLYKGGTDQLDTFSRAPILQYVEKRVQERAKLQSELTEEQSTPEDIARARRIRELEPLQSAWNDWVHTKQSLQETVPLLSDPDPTMRALAEEEHEQLNSTLATLVSTTFPSLLVPPSTTTHLSAMLELKAGVGGSEAALFLSEIVRMYVRLAHARGWKSAVIVSNETENGGTKDAILEIKGEKAYDTLRWESGVHRVQRVPATESGGRVHTSTVAVVVLPLSDDAGSSEKEDDLFSMADIRVEVMRSRGAGGQHVNKTESAVRLTHMPTGITVSMQDERSQHQNRRRAFQVLRARLMDRKLTQDVLDRREARRSIVHSADRSEKVRTYNYAQDRVTDHRIGLSLMNLMSVMEGDALQDILDALERKHGEDILEGIVEAP